jgi:hypothetical protein
LKQSAAARKPFARQGSAEQLAAVPGCFESSRFWIKSLRRRRLVPAIPGIERRASANRGGRDKPGHPEAQKSFNLDRRAG